jgi:hypothetical protein
VIDRDDLREHRREQAAQLTVKFPQPCPVFYDGPDGRLVVLSSHEA